MTYTNEQLRRTLAKMLPEKVKHTSILVWTTPVNYCCQVRYTELLHLCWLVERSISNVEQYKTWEDMLTHTGGLSATWQQRTIALAKTLGVEIV